MKKDDYSNMIEDYLDGSMCAEERAEFERLLSVDPAVRSLLDERKKFQELYVTSHRITQLRSKISNAINTEKTVITTNPNSFRWATRSSLRTISVAAAIVALAVIGSVLLFDTGSGKDEEFIAKAVPKSDSIAGKPALKATEYANKDIVRGKGTFDDYFPDEFTLLYVSDTIRFTWPEPASSRYLMLFDSKGKLVKKLKLKKKASEYLLLPGILGEGTYYWKFMNDTALIRITVNKEP